jgi:hypothetical protein
MVTSGRAGSQVARARPRGRNLLSRIFVALSEARMRQAQREIARHRHLFADEATGRLDEERYF